MEGAGDGVAEQNLGIRIVRIRGSGGRRGGDQHMEVGLDGAELVLDQARVARRVLSPDPVQREGGRVRIGQFLGEIGGK